MFLFNFLHTYQPQPIILRLGVLNIYWYGLLIVLGILLAYFITVKLGKSQPGGLEIRPLIQDLSFYLVIFGLIGARLYHLLSELPYYLKNPFDAFKIWLGGLGIYGAVIAGLIVILIYVKKHRLSFLFLADLIAPGLIIAQAVGRWGNYFNSEVFGWPTNLPWGIPIFLSHRPAEFLSAQYFHPCFLYESIWNFLIFLFLIFLRRAGLRRGEGKAGKVVAFYLILYSFGRFWLEFLRIDSQPMLLGLRLAQIISILMFLVGLFILVGIKINRDRTSV